MKVMRHHDDRIVLQGGLPMPPDEVFAAFTAPDRLTAWWPEEADVDLQIGGAYRLSWPHQEWSLRGRYLEIQAPTRLRFTWSWDHEQTPERTVTIDLAPSGAGSVITVDHTCGSKEEGQSYIDGWQFFLSRLAS